MIDCIIIVFVLLLLKWLAGVMSFVSLKAEKGDTTHKPEPGGGPHSFALRILRWCIIAPACFHYFLVMFSGRGYSKSVRFSEKIVAEK